RGARACLAAGVADRHPCSGIVDKHLTGRRPPAGGELPLKPSCTAASLSPFLPLPRASPPQRSHTLTFQVPPNLSPGRHCATRPQQQWLISARGCWLVLGAAGPAEQRRHRPLGNGTIC